MGVWMNNIRPGKVVEATVIGIVLLMAALLGGQWVAAASDVGAGLHLVGHAAGVGGDDLRTSSRRSCRSGCCWRRATTCRRS